MGTEKNDTLLRIKHFRNKTFVNYVTLVHWILFCHFQIIPTEASEEGTENYGDGAGTATPTPASSQKKMTVWQDHFIRRCMSEPGTEFYEKDG
jgi:hypothetical protein